MQGLGERMKENYEEVYKIRLPMRMPVIIRLDGKSFHSLKLEKPFDREFMDMMDLTTIQLCKEIQGTVLAYIQSDEISILLHNYKNLDSQAWFNNELQKIVSISAALASSFFTRYYDLIVQFDSRAFVIPESEVCNYFIWRQRDCENNSVLMLAQSIFSHKQLHGKNIAQLKILCSSNGTVWEELSTDLKRGRCCVYDSEWKIDYKIPIFTKSRSYIEKLLEINTRREMRGGLD